MAAITLITFDDLLDAAAEACKIQSSDTTNRSRLKRLLNVKYLEVCAAAQWDWLRGEAALVHRAALDSGTVAVTESSTAITLSATVALSRAGWFFSVQGDTEIYRIAEHTAGSASMTLDVPYQGETATAASYEIWTDALPLPVDAREVVQITHDYLATPLEGVGLRKLREIVAVSPKRDARPDTFTVTDFKEPAAYGTIGSLPALSTRASSGTRKTLVFASTVAALLEVGDRIQITAAGDHSYNCETIVESVSTSTIAYLSPVQLDESATADATLTVKLLSTEAVAERQRQLLVHPSLNTEDNTVLKVDYTRDIKPMEDDSDEPLMPIADRSVLLHGALSEAFASIVPNEAQQARHERLFNTKLAKMMGKVTESTDFPRLVPSKSYLARKRAGNRRGRRC
jgi:hypothetical protein